MVSLLRKRALVSFPSAAYPAPGYRMRYRATVEVLYAKGGKNLGRPFPGLQYFPFANEIGSNWAL
jgi:hypothetical protein